MASPFHQPYLPPAMNPYGAPTTLAAPVLPPTIKRETSPFEPVLPTIPPAAEPILPSPDAPSPSAIDGAASASSKKKVARAGHGVGAGGGGASTYKNKPLMWVPPPTYPYNLIPGRDLYADVIPPRPTEAEQCEGSGWYKVPFTGEASEPGPSGEVKKKKKPSGKKRGPKGEGGEEDGCEDEEGLAGAGASSLGAANVHDPEGKPKSELSAVANAEASSGTVKKKKPKSDATKEPSQSFVNTKKPGYRDKTEKAKLLDQEKEEKEREKAEKAAARAEKAGQKSKASGAASASTAKGKATGSSSKGKSVAFTANQGVRVEGARNAIREDVEEEEELEDEIEIDTRLYCVCKQMYDDDRIMIACDNCDDWCHPGCVGLPETDLDLVDLFFCPSCTASTPSLSTTYKTACAGDSCRRPARLPLSKFCSDECGIECVMKRVDKWCMEIDPPPPPPPIVDNALAVPASRSRSKSKTKTPSPVVTPPPPEPSETVKTALTKLEASSAVRLAKRREGLVSIEEGSSTNEPSLPASGRKLEEERMLSRYRESLSDIKTEWATKVRALAAAQARLVLLDVAVQRSEWLDFSSEDGGKCGFDGRLAMDEEEWAEWVEGEEGRRAFEGYGIGEETEAMGVDPADKAKELEIVENVVCFKRKKCDRHGGWQKLKKLDFELEQRLLDESLQKLKAREQDLRSRIADIETLRTPPNTVSRRPLGTLVVNPHSPAGTPPPVQVIVVTPSSPMQVDDRRTAIFQNLDALEAGAGAPDVDVDMVKDMAMGDAQKSVGNHSAFTNVPTVALDEHLQTSVVSEAGVIAELPFPEVIGFDGNDTEMQDVEVDVLG